MPYKVSISTFGGKFVPWPDVFDTLGDAQDFMNSTNIVGCYDYKITQC